MRVLRRPESEVRVLEIMSEAVESADRLLTEVDAQLVAFFSKPQSSLLDTKRNLALAGDWGDEPLAECLTNASVFLLAATEHLRSAIRLLDASPHEWPLWSLDPLLRASAEASARAWYLLEPELADVDRIARYMNELIESASEYERLSSTYPLEAGPGRRLGEIYAGAEKHGLLRYKKSPWLVEYRPSATTLFKAILDGPRLEWTFRALSAGAHPVVWSVVGRAPLLLGKWQGDEPSWLRTVALLAPLDDTITILVLAMDRWFQLVNQDVDSWQRAVADWTAASEDMHGRMSPPT